MFFKANADYPEPDDFVGRASELGAVFNGDDAARSASTTT